MGHGIAQGQRRGRQGRDARIDRELAEEGQGLAAGNLARQVEKGKVDQTTADAS